MVHHCLENWNQILMELKEFKKLLKNRQLLLQLKENKYVRNNPKKLVIFNKYYKLKPGY